MTQTQILGVHGVNNFQPGLDAAAAGARLSGWWRSALQQTHRGDLSVEVYYYAHLVSSQAPQGDGDLARLDEDTTAAITGWASQLGAYDEMPQGRLTEPARRGIEWVARRFGLDHRMVTRFVTTFFPEVSRYFTDERVRTAVVDGLAQALTRLRPRILIAHSLGSVVAYETLWSDPRLEVDLLLTLGSPLAMPDVVYDRLADHAGPRGRPPGVRRWINIADRGDLIAIPSGGIGRGFREVAGDISDSIHAFDFHRSTNYLACPATTAALAASLG